MDDGQQADGKFEDDCELSCIQTAEMADSEMMDMRLPGSKAMSVAPCPSETL